MRLPIDHFDLIARWYDRIGGRPADDPLPRLLDPRPGHVVLDVGGGTGRNAQALQDSGSRVILCDFSRRMAVQARARNVPVALASAAHLPFSDACADRALVVDAFHHFVQPSPEVAQPAVVAELLRALKPGGRIVIEELDVTNRDVRWIIRLERLLLMGSRFLTPDQLRGLFEAAGARTVLQEQRGGSVWLVFAKG